MRLQYLLLVLALIGCQLAVSGQDARATVISGAEAAATVDALGEKGDEASTTTTQDKPQIPSQDAILAQLPPITPLRSGIPSLDAFYMLFPALGSLLRWGSLFPAHTILGAVPDTLPSVPTQPQAAASKVVLVLADDAQAKSRVARQNAGTPALNGPDMFTSLLGQMAPQNLGQMMSPESFGQFVPQVGQALQNFQLPQGLPFQGLDNFLGAPLPVLGAPPPTPAPAPAPKSVSDDPAPAPATPSAGPLAAFFNPSNFDAPSLLGQMQAQLPPLPAAQAGTPDIMAGLRQFWSGAAAAAPAAGSEAQASDISEVRVKPGEQLAQLKIKTPQDLDQDKDQENVPLLWFRLPMSQEESSEKDKTIEDQRIKNKLQAFERQVINELKLLQQIERLAKEMRAQASAQGASPYKLNYPLSRTPVHKITRADIERALRDDYVRRLLHKEAQRKSWIGQKAKYIRDEAAQKQTGAALKRQANLSKDDIVKMMAYAYRMASEQQQQAEEKAKDDKIYAAYKATAQQTQKDHKDIMLRQMPEDEGKEQQQQQAEQNPMMMRQMAEEQARQQMAQNPMMMRQMAQEQARQQMAQNPMMMRQMAEEQARQQMAQNPMMMQQRQMAEEQARQQMAQNPMMMRQMAEEQARQQMAQNPMMMRQMAEEQARQQAAQNPMMMQQRQMAEDLARQQAAQNPALMQQGQIMEQARQQMAQNPMMMRQMAEEEARQQMAQNPMMMQQRQMAEDLARQQAEQNPALMQQRQMAEEQAKIQHLQMQQRQMAEEQARQQQQQQQQAAQNPTMMMQQRQMAEEKVGNPQEQSSLDEQKWTDDKLRAMQQLGNIAENQPQDAIVGEAEPQMPENAGQARHKVDPLGLGGNKRKKSKSNASPTIINYYQSARPSYAPSYTPSYTPSYAPSHTPSHAPSYGTSYGNGGYGSNAYGPAQSGGYRSAALGNDEIDEMLRQHRTMAATHFRQ